MTLLSSRVLALSLLALAAGAQAQSPAALPQPTVAQLLVIDLSGSSSMDALGDPDNPRLSFNIGAGSVVVGFGWDLTLSTVGASWLSEVYLNLGDAEQLRPGEGDDFGGSDRIYSTEGLQDLVGAGRSFGVGPSGLLTLELYELSDDNPDAADAFYLAGSKLTVAYVSAVPEPARFGLMALGLAGLGLARRRAP